MAIGPFDQSAKERLSALADGELDAADPAATCAIWAAHPDARRDWHAWHLIGDVLRSEDLASDPRRDRLLRAAVHARLEREAVVLAPMPARAPNRAHWPMAAAVAAGCVLVAGTFALLRSTDPAAPPALAQAGTPAVVATAPNAAPPAPIAPELVVADNRLIRDTQLDGYLVAHKQFSGTSALGVPSVFLRSATVDSSSAR